MFGEEVAQQNEGVFNRLTNGTSDEDMIKIGGGILLAVLLLRRLIR
jgi:hypothetical protein